MDPTDSRDQTRSPESTDQARRWSSERSQPAVVTAIAAGGALGATARYGVAQLITGAPDRFPWATFWTNVSGSFAIGVVLMLVLERFPSSRFAQPFLATGFLGGFTTFSSFAVESDVLVKDGHLGTAIAYIVSSLVVGLAAVWAGIACGRSIAQLIPSTADDP